MLLLLRCPTLMNLNLAESFTEQCIPYTFNTLASETIIKSNFFETVIVRWRGLRYIFIKVFYFLKNLNSERWRGECESQSRFSSSPRVTGFVSRRETETPPSGFIIKTALKSWKRRRGRVEKCFVIPWGLAQYGLSLNAFQRWIRASVVNR